MGRIIGIQHRVKKSAEGESRPTIVAISDGEDVRTLELETEQDELDFVVGRFPLGMRVAREGEDLSVFAPHHVKKTKERTTVPNGYYEGIAAGDTVVTILGGSVGYLAYAAARVAAQKGARVVRIAPANLANERAARNFPSNKTEDARLLTEIARERPDICYAVVERDLAFIKAKIRYNNRIDAMKSRIACEQRLRQRYIGNIFTSEDGLYPEGGIEKSFAAVKASDAILEALIKEEKRTEKELEAAIEPLEVFQKVFKPIEGVGVKLASRIIANVICIRQFATEHKFVAFCGLHVLSDGRFARRRDKERANWNSDCRQAIYLFVSDQCNKRPNSHWGQKLRATKAAMRQKHPEPVVGENGKKRYTDGHIHKMACWRVATRFARHIYNEWQKLEQPPAVQRLAA